jgi:hypothetical protein
MKQWYVTTGAFGGQYAMKAEKIPYELAQAAGCTGSDDCNVRLAPPELVEWLDAPTHCIMAWNTDLLRAKVPGGWIYYQHEISRDPDNGMRIIHDSAQCFVPVALASGITIIGELHD